MKKETNIVDLNNESFEQLSTNITSSIISLKLEQIENLKSIEEEKLKLLKLREEFNQILSEIDKVSRTISKLKYNKRQINSDIRTGTKKSYKLNKSYTSGIAQINLDEYYKEGKRK